jgi:hypothetical protein
LPKSATLRDHSGRPFQAVRKGSQNSKSISSGEAGGLKTQHTQKSAKRARDSKTYSEEQGRAARRAVPGAKWEQIRPPRARRAALRREKRREKRVKESVFFLLEKNSSFLPLLSRRVERISGYFGPGDRS